MGTTTAKLGLYKPYESDNMDIGDLNGNMDKIDALTHIIASGQATAGYCSLNTTTLSGSTYTWHYQKTDDGLIRAWCQFTRTDMICNEAYDDMFRSGFLNVKYPDLGQKKIISRNVWCSPSTGINFVADASSLPQNVTYETFRLWAMKKETKAASKYIYMSFVATC